MFEQETRRRRSFDEIAREVDAEFAAPKQPVRKRPQKTLDEIAREVDAEFDDIDDFMSKRQSRHPSARRPVASAGLGDDVDQFMSARRPPADEGEIVHHGREYVGPEPGTAADRTNKDNWTRPYSTGPLSAMRNKRGEPYKESELYRELVDANPINREWAENPDMILDLGTGKLKPKSEASKYEGAPLPIEKPAGQPVTKKPLNASEKRFTAAAQAIREIERRKSRAVSLFQEADRAPEFSVDGSLNPGERLRARAEGELETANRLGEEAKNKFGDLVEVGFGNDADPKSGRKWVYAKPRNEAVEYYRRPGVVERAGASTRAEIDRATKEQAAREAYNRKSAPARFGKSLVTGLAIGGDQIQKGFQRAAGTALGAAQSVASGAPFEVVDIRNDAWKRFEEKRERKLAEESAYTNDYVRDIGAALPVAGGAILAAEAGGLPGLAAMNASLEDWQDPTRSAIRTALNTAVPIAGAKLVGAAAKPIVGRIASPAGRTSAQIGSEIIGGGATNAAQTAGEQAVFDGEVDPNKVLRSAVVGGALGAATGSATARDAANANRAKYLADKATESPAVSEALPNDTQAQPETVIGSPESYNTQEFPAVRPQPARTKAGPKGQSDAIPQNRRVVADDDGADVVGEYLARKQTGDQGEAAPGRVTPDDDGRYPSLQVPTGEIPIVPREPAIPRAGEGEPLNPQAAELTAKANEAAASPTNDLPEPTEAQREANNYRKGNVRLHGLDVAIEYPAGSTRRGKDKSGNEWQVEMTAHYGAIRRTVGADGEQVDVYIGNNPASEKVFVVDQVNADSRKFDEHKAILGANSLDEAQSLYDAHFADGKGPDRRGAVTEMSVDEFKNWLKNEDVTKPVAFDGKDAAASIPAGATAYREAVRTYLQRRQVKAERAADNATKRQQAEALNQIKLDPDNPLVQHLRNLKPDELAGELAALGEDPAQYSGRPDLMQKAYLKALADYQPDLRTDSFDEAQQAIRARAVEKLAMDEAAARKLIQDADEAIRAPKSGKEADYLDAWQQLTDAGLSPRELDALRDSMPRPEPKFVADARKRVEAFTQGRQVGGGQQIIDYVVVKGYDVYRAGMDFAAWAKQVVDDLGDSARPHLERVWNRIQSSETARGPLADTMKRLEAQRAVRDASAQKLAGMSEGDLRRFGRALGVELPETAGAPAERQADLARTLVDLSSAMQKLGAPTVSRAREIVDGAMSYFEAGPTKQTRARTDRTLQRLTSSEIVALRHAVPVGEQRPLGLARSVSFAEDATARDPQGLADTLNQLTAPKRAAQKISRLQDAEAQRQSAIEAEKRAEMSGRPEASKVIPIDQGRLARLLAASEKAKPQLVLDAEQRLTETMSGRRAGSGAEALTDLAIVAGHRVYRAGMEFGAWARDVIKEAGEAVRPYLQTAWQTLRENSSFGEIPETRGGTVLGTGFGGIQGALGNKSLPSPPVIPSTTKPPAAGKKPLPPLPSPPPAIGQKPPARTPVLETISALRKAGLLTGLKTHLRNVGGTAAFQGVEEFARVPGAMMDLALSAVTGQRGLTGANAPAVARSGYEAATKGIKDAWQILKKGAPADDLERLQLHPETRTGSRILDGYVNGVFRLMAAEDRVFRTFAMRRSLEDRARAMALTEARQGKLDRNKVGERTEQIVASPPEDMVADAILDAEVATFNNSNKLSDSVGNFRHSLSPEGQFAMEMVLPFDRTPTNVIARTLEYSPLGFADNARQVAKAITKKSFTAADQRAFSQKFGRASIGSGLIWLGYTLASKQLMTGMSSDQEAQRERDELAGRPPAAIFDPLTNTWHQVGAFTPVGSLLAVGASFYKAQNGGKEASPLESATKIGGDVVFEQPLLHTTKDIAEGMKQPKRLTSTAGRIAGSFVPTMVSDVAAVMDDRQREARGFTPQLQRRIPFLRESLPAAKDVFGQPLEFRRTDFFDPTLTRTARERTQPFERELVRLGVGVGPLKPRARESADELNDRRAAFGEKYRDYGEMLIDDAAYQDAGPELQREALQVLSERLRRRISADFLSPVSLLAGAKRELQRKLPDKE